VRRVSAPASKTGHRAAFPHLHPRQRHPTKGPPTLCNAAVLASALQVPVVNGAHWGREFRVLDQQHLLNSGTQEAGSPPVEILGHAIHQVAQQIKSATRRQWAPCPLVSEKAVPSQTLQCQVLLRCPPETGSLFSLAKSLPQSQTKLDSEAPGRDAN